MIEYDITSVERLRTSLRLSQERFAEKLGISRQWVNSLEGGKFHPKAALLARIMQTFGVEASFFFVDKNAYEHTHESGEAA